MTDSEQKPDGTGAGLATQNQTSPDQTSQTGSPENTQQATPQYVTLDDLKKFGSELAGQLKQSDRDRTKRIEGELTSIKQLLEKPGVQLNDQQVIALREEIAQRIDNETEGGTSQQVASTSQQESQPTYDEVVTGYVNSVMAETGTTVTEQDPEWQTIKAAFNAAYTEPDGAKGLAKITNAITQAANAKKIRTAANQETAAARVSGSGNSVTGTSADAPAIDLFKQAYNK